MSNYRFWGNSGRNRGVAFVVALASLSVLHCTTESENGNPTGTDGGTSSGSTSGSTSSGTVPEGGTDGGPVAEGPIKRTLVYHQITKGENDGPDGTKGIAFSRDGSRGLYDENIGGNYHPVAISFDGATKKDLDAVSAGWIDMSAVNGDGSLVAYTGGSLLFNNVTSPARITGPSIGATSSVSRYAKDPAAAGKWRVYFATRAVFDVPSAPPTKERGIYSIGSDGSGITSLLTPQQAATAIGGGVTFDQLAPKANRYTIDVSEDGKKWVAVWSAGYCTQTGQKDYILAGTSDGGAKMIAGPITAGCGVDRLALSGDGNTVAYATARATDGDEDLVTLGFDGGGKKDLDKYSGSANNNWGLSDDGKRLVAGYRLYDTAAGTKFDLALTGGTFSGDPPSGIDLFLGALSGKGDRVLYIDTLPGTRRMATLEIDPASTGAAPTITAPTVTPASVPLDGSSSATVTVKVAAAGKVERVGIAGIKDGLHDIKGLPDLVLLDDGTHGDAVAGDGIYSSNELKAFSEATAGTRLIRVRATTIDADGKSHSTAIDFGPFDVK
jgi:hypothetical protein